MSDQAVLNTDREIWRERHDDNYADSIHVTERGGIGINCGGMVYVKPVREWHKSAATIASLTAEVERLRAALKEIEAFTCDVPDDHPLSHACGVARAALSASPALDKEVEAQRDFVEWVDTWVSNPVTGYSVYALDGLFGMARDKIAAIRSLSNQTSAEKGE